MRCNQRVHLPNWYTCAGQRGSDDAEAARSLTIEGEHIDTAQKGVDSMFDLA